MEDAEFERKVDELFERVDARFSKANALMENWNRFVDSYIEIRDELDEKTANRMDELVDRLAKSIKKVVWQN